MKRQILFTAQGLCTNNWFVGFFLGTNSFNEGISYIGFSEETKHIVKTETVCQFSGKKLAKGQKIFEGTIAFHEEELNEGDRRTYVVCVFIDEWSMFAFLTVDEYLNYLEQGAESLDEELFWTYTLQQSEKYHYAGNIFDNPELLNPSVNSIPQSASHEQV